MTAEANGSVGGKDVDFDGGLVLVPNKAYVSYEGERLRSRPDDLQLRPVGDRRSRSRKAAPKAAPRARPPARKRRPALNADDFVDNLTNEGSADVGGTETTKVSGDLNVSGALDAIIELTEIPACSSQLEAAGPLPLGELEEAQGEIEKALKSAHADVYVGDDNIIRRFTAELDDRTAEGSGETVDDRHRPLRSTASTRTRRSRPRPARSRSTTSSRSSASTRSNCSRARRAAPASAACSKRHRRLDRHRTAGAPGGGPEVPRTPAAAARANTSNASRLRYDAGRPAELRRRSFARSRHGRWKAAERRG